MIPELVYSFASNGFNFLLLKITTPLNRQNGDSVVMQNTQDSKTAAVAEYMSLWDPSCSCTAQLFKVIVSLVKKTFPIADCS